MATLLRCQVCGAHPEPPTACPECQALAFCSPEHLRLRASRVGHDAEECGRMRQQLARAAEVLEAHTLAWPRPQTQEELLAWLRELGCGAHSLCMRACVTQQRPFASEAAACETGLPASQQEWEAAWALPGQQMVPAWPASEHPTACSCWAEYYAARHMRPTSPAALALHAPLTLWHVLAQLLPSRGWQLPPPGATVRVAYLGPQVELRILPAFVELALLLPDHHLDLHFVGPDVPDKLHRRTCSAQLQPGGSLAVSCWAGCFHDLLQDWQHDNSSTSSSDSTAQAGGVACTQQAAAAGAWRAAAPPCGRFDCVFAANAGVPVYPSWLPTLKILASGAPASTCTSASQPRDQQQQHQQGAAAAAAAAATPVVFTDYCEEAAVKAQALATQLLGRPFSLAPRLNPFRCPAPTHSHGTLLPACSNAFLFGWV